MRVLLVVAGALLLVGRAALAQELDPDPDRVFVTPLKWERVAGAPHSEGLRYANGTLVIFYLEGVYAEVTASFIKTDGKHPVGLNLNEGFIVRLGTWSRTEDEVLIHVQSREVVREKQIRMLNCKTDAGNSPCEPIPEGPLPGPLKTRTCRLERPSSTHLAETIVCDGLVVDHAQKKIDLNDFPSIVRQLVAAQKKESSSSTH
jgi:hypothetical protein